MANNNILDILKKHQGTLITGSDIAKQLGITRSYVNKVVKELQTKGYEIKSENRTGYIYINDTRVLDASSIQKNLKNKVDIIILDEVDSTNRYLKELAKNSTINHMVVIANQQTGGRGRLGRNFVSSQGKGIYMSILIRPDFSIHLAKKITCMVSVAITKAIDKLTGAQTSIKWVNDIYLNHKKICGILTEGATSLEQNSMEYVIIGIGINCYHQVFDEELGKKATTIEDELGIIVSRNELISKIINEVDEYISDFDASSQLFMKEYIDKSFVIGRDVELQKGNTIMLVKVKDINSDGELIVEDIDKKEITFASGEITRMIIK